MLMNYIITITAALNIFKHIITHSFTIGLRGNVEEREREKEALKCKCEEARHNFFIPKNVCSLQIAIFLDIIYKEDNENMG